MSIVIFADSPGGKFAKSAFEAVYFGSKLASQMNKSAVVVTYGNADAESLTKLASYGASKVLINRQLTTDDAQKLSRLVLKAVQDESADTVIFSHDYTAKAVAPRVAARLNAGIVTGVIDFPNTDGAFTVKKSVFSGKAYANYVIKSEKKVLTLLPNSVKPEPSGTVAQIADYNVDTGSSGIILKEFKKKGGEGVVLTEADIVVSGGRGLKGPENWGMIEDMAKALGAATSCSRPVADIGWRPHHEHVGQTGTAIRPNLYFAIGISGAIQHLAGVNGSKVIVVINSDAEAPFFKAADYGIIGDAFDVVPKLTETIKKFKATVN